MTPLRSLGGLARAESLTPERRSEIASEAARARWERRRGECEPAGAEPGPPTPKPRSRKPSAVRRDSLHTAPWQCPALRDWLICGMNHYHVKGRRRLFVSMTRGGRCITAEGADNQWIWEDLADKARVWRDADGGPEDAR
jgi:hypothetical protein